MNEIVLIALKIDNFLIRLARLDVSDWLFDEIMFLFLGSPLD